MNMEEMVAAIEAEGWFIWNLQRDTKGRWMCRLCDPVLERKTNGARGATGYDRECWRTGTGPTMLAAVSAAAAELLPKSQPAMEEDLDLAAMLS